MINAIMITNGHRPDLLQQSLESLLGNARQEGEWALTLVIDGADEPILATCLNIGHTFAQTIIQTKYPVGASAARNIGASSILKHRRQGRVMFIDDDVYMLTDWDRRLGMRLGMWDWDNQMVLSGHAHPYNHSIGQIRMSGGGMVDQAGVISTVHMIMPWAVWDDVGYFAEPGGAGGSEDVDWCARAVKKGYRLAITNPQCVLHCGLTSTNGNRIVGYDLMWKQNQDLVEQYGLTGKVKFG